MPPKAKFTKEEIIEAALSVVREKGMDALTARSLAQQLKSSAQPIFTVFKNMEEVQDGVKKAAQQTFDDYIRDALSYTPAFKQAGVLVIRFAIEEPKLFQLLFMWERQGEDRTFRRSIHLSELTDIHMDALWLEIIQREYELTREEAQILFEQVWIFTVGIGVLCATRACCFGEEELEELLGREFISMLLYIKGGRLKEKTPHPMRKDEEMINGD